MSLEKLKNAPFPLCFHLLPRGIFFYIVIEKSESTVPEKPPFGTKSFEPEALLKSGAFALCAEHVRQLGVKVLYPT